MADDKTNRSTRDQATVSGSETYEVDYFAKKHGLTREEAQSLIDRVGNSRAALEAAVPAKSKPGPRKSNAGRKPATRTSAGKVPAKTTASSRVKKSVVAKAADVAATIVAEAEAAVAQLAEPVAAEIAPVRRRAGAAQRKVTKGVRRGSSAARASTIRAARTAGIKLKDAVETVETAVEQLVAPVSETITSVPRKARATQQKVTKAAKSGASSTRKTAARATRAVRESADDAVEAATNVVTGKTASSIGIAALGLLAGLAANFGRKMLVQAPSALAGDWFDALKAEHRLALGLFDKLQGTDNTQIRQRNVLLTQLKHALGKHAFTEENVIYPALRAWGDKADADKLNHDHGYVKQYLYELEELDNASPAFLETVGNFRSALESHIREEESAIFPPLHAALGKAGNAKVTAQANKEGFKLA
jgi:ElaB/YqjD/DUF883 family membrane-anchored ribosome-binding protein/hemerythrin superfamily protein